MPKAPSERSALEAFDKHAKLQDSEGNKYLGPDDFLHAVAPPNENYEKISRNSYLVLFDVADTSKQGRISKNDWLSFCRTLERPDAEYQIAFQVFDRQGTGHVNFDEFVQIYNANKSEATLPFDWSTSWASLYLGGQGSARHSMSYNQFSQMLRGLSGERIRQAFIHFDTKETGFITVKDFETIVSSTVGHKLSNNLLGHLSSITDRPGAMGRLVSYATVRAFHNLINNSEVAEAVAETVKDSKDEFSKRDFMDAAASHIKFFTLTPLEVDLLFHFAQTERGPQFASIDNLQKMFDPLWRDPVDLLKESTLQKAEAAKNAAMDPKSFLMEVFENVYNFALGSIAGAFGATVVYPIDLVKTRMQNQRKVIPGHVQLYSNSLDCFKKVIAREGVFGLYSGLLPQLVGVAPEKAIKLTVNDLLRGMNTDSNGRVPLGFEILAGGSAGACQVIFTNPLEIVKIRLQVQGEIARAEGIPKRSALSIVKQLGLVGLYKGASACLLRDVPFSAIYFPVYAHLKQDYFQEGPTRKLKVWELLTAGAIAGIPAAYLTTPCDVIKTRLQVEARKGQTSYTGLRHAAATIWHEEGLTAFFKGGPARILRSSPQFGCTLAAYEVLKRFLPFPGSTKHNEAGHVQPSSELHTPPRMHLRSRNSLKVLLDINENFGKPLSSA